LGKILKVPILRCRPQSHSDREKTGRKNQAAGTLTLVLTFQNIDGELISASFRVAGIFRNIQLHARRNECLCTAERSERILGAGNIINEIAMIA
jgi:hypothetical protein